MADAQIATVLIPCLVIQLNNQKFIENEQVIGQTLDVPCRNALIDEIGYWAVPIKDNGIFTTLQYILMVDNGRVSVPQPTFDSFPIFRVRDKLSGYNWWIYGTKDNFLNSCNSSGVVPMPGIDGQFVPMIAPCQLLCDLQNSSGAYQAIFALPTLVGHEALYPYGSYNNVAWATASGAGYATPAALLTYLNTTWTQGGTVSWSLTADNMTLIATGGALGDQNCTVITTIGPSS